MATAATVFRDYETDGVPASGSHKVKKSDVRQLLSEYESTINAFLSNGGLIYSSKAAMDADLAHGPNSMAWVIGDATVANNGIYRKIGASGVGSWTRVADLPFSFIIASDVGAGTPNAIQATTSIPVSGSALVWMNIFEANTASPVTVSFNGGSALTIKTNSGNDVAAGGLTAGMNVMGIVSGTTFRLVSDQASAAVLAAAEALLEDFHDGYLGKFADDAAATAAAGGSPSEGTLYWNTTSNGFLVFDGTLWVALGASAVPDGSVTRPKMATVISRTIPLNIQEYGAFGSDDPDGLVDETTQIAAAINAAIAQGRELYIPGAHYQTGQYSRTSPLELFMQGDPVSRPIFHALQSVANATGSAGRLFQFLPGGSSYAGNEVGSYALDGDVGVFQQKIKLNSVSGIQPGMMIQIASNQLWHYDDRGEYYRGEIHLIQRVLAGTNEVQIDDYTRDRYLPSSGHVVTVRVWTPSRLVWNNIAVEYPDPADNTANTRALVLDRMYQPQFNDCLVKGSTGSGILNSRSWLARYSNLEIQDTGLALSDTSSIGYGVQEASVYGSIFTGTKSRGCRRTVDFDSLTAQTMAAPSRDCIFRDFHITGSGIDGTGTEFFPEGLAPNYGVGGHGPVENLIITSGYIADVEQGINIRSRNTEISNVHFAGELGYCVYGTYGTGLEVHNCRYMRDDYPDKIPSSTADGLAFYQLMPLAFVRLGISSGVGDWDYESPVKITDNVAHGLQRAFVEFGVSATNAVENVIAKDNFALVRVATGQTFTFFNTSGGGEARVFRSCLNDGSNMLVNRGPGTAKMFAAIANMGLGSLSQGGSDAAVQIGEREWQVQIPDDIGGVIRNASRNGDQIAVQIIPNAGTAYGTFIIASGSATLTTLGAIGAGLAGSTLGSGLTGTGGADGTFNISLDASGDLYFENRTGTARRVRLRIL
ncbi:hypothetical protein KGO5_04256 [Sinorhizobium sp. KGO-5]|uniref:hypothetical protein n=1 Tax=Sinorhizobium sp. KGO-5 TaxID=1470810 RepID=UPI00294A08D9|nr:hypothetical protein KGO5_04256 [Sinorhizobium sp. KGO-5]